MSKLSFNKNFQKSTNIYNEKRIEGDNNIKLFAQRNQKDIDPKTMIKKKPSEKKIHKIESPEKKKLVVQETQNRNISKKAKEIQNQNSPKKQHINQFRTNNNINNNLNKKNEEEEYQNKVDNFLRGKSKEKEKEKNKSNSRRKFNPLKNSINLDTDLMSDNIEDPNKSLKNEINDLMNKKENNNFINNINAHTNIISSKKYNTNILRFNNEENKNNNNEEPYKIKQVNEIKDIKAESSTQIRPQIKKQNENKDTEENHKRTSIKKNTFQSQIQFKDENNGIPINIERRKSLKSSMIIPSIQNPLKDSIRRTNTLRKSLNGSINNKILIPLLNRTKENNCFLNVIIQVLFNLDEFKNELFLEEIIDISKKSKAIHEFYELFKSYKLEQQKNKDNRDSSQIEPVLSVNNLRNYLNQVYNCYRPGECGDPMETMGYIFDLIHKAYCKIYGKKKKDCKCPSHKYFFLYLSDIKSCPHCNAKAVQWYNDDCFMFNILIKEITNKLNGKNINSYKLKLFPKLKELNETYENENKLKITGCNCDNRMISAYERKLKLMGPSSKYLIINITWAEEFPSMLEILTAFGLIPLSDSIENLFTFGDELKIKDKDNEVFYIKSVILYGIYHYVCIIYMNDQKRWAIIDDKTIKYINKYYDLIDFLLRNHLMPVGIIYSKLNKDKIEENEIKSNILNKDEFMKLYNFCKDVDKRRGLKVSDLVLSKGSFNENNENYLNNNYFYKSIINFEDSPKKINKHNIDNNEEVNDKKIGEKNPKTCIIKKLVNKDNNVEHNNFLKGRSVIGDFNNQNMKGGIIVFSDSINDNKMNTNEKSEKNIEDNDLLDFGKNYEG